MDKGKKLAKLITVIILSVLIGLVAVWALVMGVVLDRCPKGKNQSETSQDNSNGTASDENNNTGGGTGGSDTTDGGTGGDTSDGNGGSSPGVSTVPEHKCEFVFLATVPVTCTEQGYDLYKCSVYSNCPKTEKKNIKNPGGHNYEYTYQDATCKTDWTRTGVCSKCGDIDIFTVEDSKKPHDYEWTVTEESTCTKLGVKTGVCSHCGAKTTGSVPKADHKYGDWYLSQGKCGSMGIFKQNCLNCGHEESKQEFISHEFENSYCVKCHKYKNPTGSDVLLPMGDLHFSDTVNSGSQSVADSNFLSTVTFVVATFSGGQMDFSLYIKQSMADGYQPPLTGFRFENMQDGSIASFEVTLWNFKLKKNITFTCHADYHIPEGEDYMEFSVSGEAEYSDGRGNTHSFTLVSDKVMILLESI